MNYPPYIPYYQYGPYNIIQGAKRDLRKTANAVCWIVLAAILLMNGFLFFSKWYLQSVGYGADTSNPDFQGFTPVLYYLAMALGYVVGLAIPVLLYFAIKRIPLEEALPFQKAGFVKVAACIFFGSAVCMLGNIPANMVVNVEKAMGFSGNLPESPLTDDPWVLILYFVTIALIPPIVEELLFRGMVLHSLRKYGDGFAIVVSALLFGLYHGNFVQMVFAFIAGLVMALVVIRTGSLWTSILIHFVNNSISFALEMVQRYAGEELANQVNSIVMGVMILLGLISVIYLLVKDKHFFRTGAPDPILRFSSKVGAAFSNPGGVAMIVFSLAMSVAVLTQY